MGAVLGLAAMEAALSRAPSRDGLLVAPEVCSLASRTIKARSEM